MVKGGAEFFYGYKNYLSDQRQPAVRRHEKRLPETAGRRKDFRPVHGSQAGKIQRMELCLGTQAPWQQPRGSKVLQ